jgi:uncharacterized protein involved in exopolysaccharide biosynthesis
MLMAQSRGDVGQIAAEPPEQGLDLSRYLAILKRRILLLVVPLALVGAVGTAIVLLLPAIYLAEGKILVESAQIPSELVRPTITATAKERIQVIEQRIMTRDNLLAIIDKFHMFQGGPQRSTTQMIDLMRARTRITPFELSRGGNGTSLAIALTIGFEHEQPDVAMRVTNELITLILAEDARNRAGRAQETTSFLAREVKRLDEAIGKTDAQIAEYRKTHTADSATSKTSLQIAMLMADLQEKTATFSNNHPEVIRLKRQLASLEKYAAQTADLESGLEALQNQRTALQRQLDSATDKLSAARLGESLEQAQFSERLEVLEQAIVPQQPLKPNRRKLLAMVLGLAVAAGAGAVFIAEALDHTLRRPRDLHGVVPASLIVAIPYIPTRREVARRRRIAVFSMMSLLLGLLAALTFVHIYFKPLDELWAKFLARIFS